ncbi:hypothetical protein [Paenibacillus massiliensis]|uniref:hypothetical protein n=1 Tax=Paenibacillus massiliensis TaxID=225917 RepID=UPI0004251438|nr:hypothetical protein [Paenibacillus massiliensis]
MSDLTGRPLLKSMMGERIWRLYKTDLAAFKQETIEYFEKGYPGWTVVRVKYPIVTLRDDRGPKA